MTETDEEVVVGKRARVIEEIGLSKEVEERTETVSDTVRRTDVEIEGADEGRGGGAFDDVEPAYRYGWERGRTRRDG